MEFLRRILDFNGMREGSGTSPLGFAQDPPVALSHRATLFIQCAGGRIDDLYVRGAIHVSEKDRAWEFALAGARHSGELCGTRAEADGRILAAWNPRDVKRWNYLLRRCALPAWSGETMYIEALAGRTPPARPVTGRSVGPSGRLAADEDRPAAMARYLDDCLTQLIEIGSPSSIARTSLQLQQWIDAGQERIDFSRFSFGPDLIARIPDSPGVYVMKNRAGSVLYVGKARNLKGRMRTYFTPRALKDSRVARIHQGLHSLEFFSTPSEIEALLLEMRLIREFHPSINIQTEVHERSAQLRQGRQPCRPGTRTRDREGPSLFPVPGLVCRPALDQAGPGARNKSDKEDPVDLLWLSSEQESAQEKPGNSSWCHRWIAANRKRLNYVDVDEAGSFDTVVRQLSHYLKDPDLLSRKVYYR